jgi:hypothetical protein
MNAISDWFQNNWIDLARLLVQCAILAVVVRYGRRMLATLRASQEQVGALLKLSVADSVEERQPAPAAEPPAREYEQPSVSIREPEPEPDREPEPEPVFAGAASRASYAEEREHTLGGRVIGAQAPAFTTSPAFTTPPGFSAAPQRAESPSLTPWVSAPVSASSGETFGETLRSSQEAAAPIAPRASASSWLQAPMRSGNGVSPWRKVVRWLQAPAGH